MPTRRSTSADGGQSWMEGASQLGIRQYLDLVVVAVVVVTVSRYIQQI